MEEMSQLTREQEVEAVMGVFGVDKLTAEALVAREHGETAGGYVAVDKTGKEAPLLKAHHLRKNPAA
jgi:hypothetical protein